MARRSPKLVLMRDRSFKSGAGRTSTLRSGLVLALLLCLEKTSLNFLAGDLLRARLPSAFKSEFGRRVSALSINTGADSFNRGMIGEEEVGDGSGTGSTIDGKFSTEAFCKGPEVLWSWVSLEFDTDVVFIRGDAVVKYPEYDSLLVKLGGESTSESSVTKLLALRFGKGGL